MNTKEIVGLTLGLAIGIGIVCVIEAGIQKRIYARAYRDGKESMIPVIEKLNTIILEEEA